MILIEWACKNYFTFVIHKPNFREAPLYENDTQVPPVVWDIRKRIMDREGLEAYSESYNERFFLNFHKSLQGVTRDKLFILSSSDDETGQLFVHRDMNQPCGIHTRFNVFLSVPEMDSKTYYAGHEVEIKERGYVMCRSGIDWHWSEPIRHTEKPRIAISFGFMLPLDVVDKIYKIPADKIKWGLWNRFYVLYDTLEDMFECSFLPMFKRLKCETGTLPSKSLHRI
jgi:hypothetical protein